MSAQLSLSPEEIAFIEAKRVSDAAAEEAAVAEQAAKAAEKVARDAEKTAEQLKSRIARNLIKADMARDLEKADNTKVLTFDWGQDDVSGCDVCVIMYDLGGKLKGVTIEPQHSSSSSYISRRTMTGYKYEIEDADNMFRTRKYKNVKTLIARVAEFQEHAQLKIEREMSTTNLIKNTLAQLKTKYPTAEIKAYKPSKYADHCSQWDTTYHITMPKGLVVFRTHMKDDVVVFTKHKVVPSKELLEDVADQILKN